MRRCNQVGVAFAMLAILLAGCGKGDDAKNAKAANAAAQNTPATQAAATPAAPPSAQAVASRLVASGIAPSQGDFTLGVPMACEPASPGDAWVLRCRAMFYDGERNGNPAVVEIQLFDHDMDFAAADKTLKANVAALGGDWTMDTAPDISFTAKDSKTATKLAAACHQSLGQYNSNGYCAVMATPRAYLAAAVSPKNESTTKLTISTGKGKDPDQVDVDHAQALAIQGALDLIEIIKKAAAGPVAPASFPPASSPAFDPATGATYGCEAQFGVGACSALLLVSGPVGQKIDSTNLWGAVAISSSKMDFGYSYRYANAQQAETEALRRCAGLAGATDCKLVFDVPGYCVAIAMSPTNWGVGGLSAATDIAEKDSLLQCQDKGCAVKVGLVLRRQPAACLVGRLRAEADAGRAGRD